MDEFTRKYLEAAFRHILNYDADDPMQPVDPLTYVTPEGDSCLHIAAARGDLQAVRFLLDAGLDVNRQGDMGNTALHYAKTEEIARLLLEHGASAKVCNEFGKLPAFKG